MSIETLGLIIFIITYIGIIFTRLPKVNIDRPSAAFTGAVAMIVFGVISFEDAIKSIDFNTITLLLGMMIIVSTLKLEGFFSLIASKTISYSHSRNKLLIIIVFITGIASAFLVNDAVVLLFTPIIISICRKTNLNPIPYLIAEILSSNIGSAMTITGNPQNMLIGISSNISYVDFLIKLLPISIIGMLIIVLVVKLFYRKHFQEMGKLEFQSDYKYDFKKMRISVLIFLLVILGFFFGKILSLSIPIIALMGASLILLFGKAKPSSVIKDVDWVLLLFFACLFILVSSIQSIGLLDRFINIELNENLSSIIGLHSLSLVMSQILSNVPYTVLMTPLMEVVNNENLWLALASSATLAGNATIIGAMANLIVIESSEKENVKISFWEFFKIGIVTTIITLLLSIALFYIYSII
ncbi:MAG: anion transporter [Bacteroidales bacterium]|jgi:Na+/H+ antiporter NhaD/arsenite permease-like protein|nr:anion transporter [Bacteroidales bacterium]MDX9798491.1 anion transporter [Bacteroidales bacterium]